MAGPSQNAAGRQSWYYEIAPVTRTMLTSIVAIVVLYKLSLLNIGYLVHSWRDTIYRFQVWRMFTSSVMIIPGSSSQALTLLLEFYNLYSRSNHLEKVHFNGITAEYSYYLFCSIVLITIMCGIWFADVAQPLILHAAFVSCLGYTWATDHKDAQIMYYGVIPIAGRYYPIAELVMAFVFNGGEIGFALAVIGVLSGYLLQCADTMSFGPLYWWIKGRSSSNYERGQFKAPRWFAQLFDIELFNNYAHSASNGFTGKGQRLGSSRGVVVSPASTTSAKTSDKSTTETVTKRFFPGKGQRVGG